MDISLVAVIFVIVAVIFGIINNELRASTFWFLLAICTALILSSVRL